MHRLGDRAIAEHGARRRPEAVLSALTIAVTALLAICCLPRPVAAATPVTMRDVSALVHRHLAGKPGYRSGDLIARDDVEPIFNDLLAMGIKPYDNQEELYDSFLPEGSDLVTALRTPAGTVFMQKISRMPGAYDRLERLSWVPEGRQVLAQLINAPEGPASLQRMSTPEGMQLVAQRLAADSRGANFALPTGHIHTEDQLVQRLAKIFAKQSKK